MSSLSKLQAELILRTHEVREASYDHATANAYLAGEPVPATVYADLARGNFESLYGLSIIEAALAACKDHHPLTAATIAQALESDYERIIKLAEQVQ